MDALIFMVLLAALALAAPRWGYDSTDGVDSPEWGRRALWRGRVGPLQASPPGAATRPLPPAPRRRAPVVPACAPALTPSGPLAGA
jgi:hypothetical protein